MLMYLLDDFIDDSGSDSDMGHQLSCIGLKLEMAGGNDQTWDEFLERHRGLRQDKLNTIYNIHHSSNLDQVALTLSVHDTPIWWVPVTVSPKFFFSPYCHHVNWLPH